MMGQPLYEIDGREIFVEDRDKAEQVLIEFGEHLAKLESKIRSGDVSQALESKCRYAISAFNVNCVMLELLEKEWENARAAAMQEIAERLGQISRQIETLKQG